MMSANNQIKGILELIQHKIDVSIASKDISLSTTELQQFPDYESIIEKLDWEDAISVLEYPNVKKLDDASIDLFEIEYSREEFNEYMSFKLKIRDKFSEVYGAYVTQSEGGVRLISQDEIQLTPSHYNASSGILTLSSYHKVEIAQRGKSATTMDTKTRQCKLMGKLFANEVSLSKGITMPYAIGVVGKKTLSNDEIKQVKNLQTEINKKFTDVTNLKNLITIKRDAVKINTIYLLKD